MKQLYIRKGNLETNQNILIIGEESVLGGRDVGYCTKGTIASDCMRKDPYTGAKGLAYIHACKNILLNSKNYKNDHDVHLYVKNYCKDLVIWDGESDTGLTNSREAFIIRGNKNVDSVVKELYNRIYKQVYPKGILQRFLAKRKLNRINRKKKKVKFSKRLKKFLLLILLVAYLYFLIKYPKVRETSKAIAILIYTKIVELIGRLKCL